MAGVEPGDAARAEIGDDELGSVLTESRDYLIEHLPGYREELERQRQDIECRETAVILQDLDAFETFARKGNHLTPKRHAVWVASYEASGYRGLRAPSDAGAIPHSRAALTIVAWCILHKALDGMNAGDWCPMTRGELETVRRALDAIANPPDPDTQTYGRPYAAAIRTRGLTASNVAVWGENDNILYPPQ